MQVHKQLRVIREYRPELDTLIANDPVRAHIPAYMRLSANHEIYALDRGSNILGVTCVAYLDSIHSIEDDLFLNCDSYDVACFYTVWSNAPGAGREVLNRTLANIKVMKPWVNYVCTLSPKTEMARRFHTANGAWLHRENETTDNYCYKMER